ncbi:histidine kinase [Shewanella sp. 202IG2-18]|uniref:sensor histidine kinase n=1 Tax=Parashewanella hymeniacidonis TaxID=2807618 RepID=UPI00195F30E6|nr:ATP-binding protein [Parashewanella hymeniacidonis]MBM7071805.1 histidine kinase [Parashewanella hymeniacidonis]
MLSFKKKLSLNTGLCVGLSAVAIYFILNWSQQPETWWQTAKEWLGFDVAWLCIALITLASANIVSWLNKGLTDSLQAIEVGLLNFKDNDFSVSLPKTRQSETSHLVELFNDVSEILREEKQYIYQRELLLDKVIQSSPNVMLLLTPKQQIIYANDAARYLFYDGRRIAGAFLPELLSNIDSELADNIKNKREGLFTSAGGEAESWHISRGTFALNNQQHDLLLIKQMTKELNRQEVAVWKKVIRLISHELNNSLAPISSMVNSGRKLTKDTSSPQLELIFNTIESRCDHLNQFIFNYARFAKLPLPQKSSVSWEIITQQLAQHYPFSLDGPLPSQPGYFDHIQLEQVLLNLLKNAHESGSEVENISMKIASITLKGKLGCLIEVSDKGMGMSAEVMQQALLPFYSTKQTGTGLGLPLCREIIEAHDGQISLHHRHSKGLTVQVWLPAANS